MTDESLFAAAMDEPTAERRQSFLDAACAGDATRRRRLERLLAADSHARGILDRESDATAIFWPGSPGSSLAPGQIFAGKFILGEKLGEGGMGEVWAADQFEPVQRRVAIKVVRHSFCSVHLLARFDQECQTLALMDHPNIGKVFDAGTDGDRPYLVMEFIDGVPLTRYCDEAGLSLRERLELFVPVCRAVQHAHQKGVIHRDLKPPNVLVALYDGRPVPKVIDFGVARAPGLRASGPGVSTEFGALVGTLESMSPEQAGATELDVDTRSDVYSLGVLLYELLTGDLPFPREQLRSGGVAEMLRILREVEPPRPSARAAAAPPDVAAARQSDPERLAKMLRGDLDWVAMKCLEKARDRRYETADALASDLRRYLAHEPVLAGPPSVNYRVRKFLQRNRGPVIAAGVLLLALGGGIVGTTMGLMRAERAKETAEKRLIQIEQGIDVLGSIFADLDARAEDKEGRPLRAILGERLDQAAAALHGEALGDPLLVAQLQDRLGESYLGLGHAAKAEALFGRAVATRQARLGPNDPLTLATIHRQAKALQDIGNLPAAIAALERVRDAQAASLGAEHPNTLATANSLGRAYWTGGRPSDAVALLESVRAAWAKRPGPTHRESLSTLDALAGAYVAVGKKAEAIELFELIKDTWAKTHGDDHFHTFVSLNNLAQAYLSAGKIRKAIDLLESSREGFVRKFGREHPFTLTALNNLAFQYRAVGRTAEGLALSEHVRDARVTVLGPHHPDTITSQDYLGVAYLAAGAPEKALAAFQRAGAGVEKLGFVHIGASRIIRNLRNCQERLGQFEDAELWRRKWLAVVKDRDGPDSPEYAAELAGLGTNLFHQKKYAEAELSLRASLARLRPGPEKRAALEHLVRLNEACGNPEAAAAWRKELEGFGSAIGKY